jgi:hypothetical protein
LGAGCTPPLHTGSELGQAAAALARAQQDAVWDRARARNKLCSHLWALPRQPLPEPLP